MAMYAYLPLTRLYPTSLTLPFFFPLSMRTFLPLLRHHCFLPCFSILPSSFSNLFSLTLTIVLPPQGVFSLSFPIPSIITLPTSVTLPPTQCHSSFSASTLQSLLHQSTSLHTRCDLSSFSYFFSLCPRPFPPFIFPSPISCFSVLSLPSLILLRYSSLPPLSFFLFS